MKKLCTFLILLSSLAFSTTDAQGQNATYDLLRSGFKNPPATARPKVYWWCLNGNIDTVRAKEEFLAMKNAGLSGFDLFEIGVPKGDTIPGGPAFLSDKSLEIIRWVVAEAGKQNLTVGLNLASSWNAGGSWIKPRHGGKSLYFSSVPLSGNSSLQNIKLPFPEISFPKSSIIGGSGKPMIPFRDDGKPEYYEEVSVLAIPAMVPQNKLDTTQIINLSAFFNKDTETLNWRAPAGDWLILRYVCSNSGQQLVLPSPLSAGLTIDHFDPLAVETHLMYVINRLKPVLGDFRQTALKSFYLASYEARGFVWTSSLPEEFRKINGYDIYKFLPCFFDPELYNPEINSRVKADFRKTLSELMINNLYKKSKEICNSYGLKINCEAGGPGYPLYNGPAEPLKALGALDIPRGEFWINHSRYYMDDNGKDSIDILRVVKEVAAASHIYEKGIVEEEAFTSFQHWQEGPSDMKPAGDRAFCEGMNKVVFHGFSHNPRGTGYPGIVYHAGTHFNDKRVWWTKAKPFIDYLSRASFIFQEADFVADVLYYYGDQIPNSVTPKNTHFSVAPGYDYEVINTEILLSALTVKDGSLQLSNGARFSMLALENQESINPYVLARLNELAGKGAIITGARPEKFSKLKNFPEKNGIYKRMLNELWEHVDDPAKFVINNSAKVYSGIKPVDVLKALKLNPDFSHPGDETSLSDFIHYQVSGVDFYFIRNTTSSWFSEECDFRQQAKIPEIWDPVSGETVSVTVYREEGSSTKIPLTLPPYCSCFVVFRNTASPIHYTHVYSADKTTPRLKFTNDGIIFLNDGTYSLTGSLGSEEVISKKVIQTIEGPWSVSFSSGWGAPGSSVFDELISWTDSEVEGIRFYSGIGTYNKSFHYNDNAVSSGRRRVYLDLGDLSKIAEIWLNGHPLGISWTMPHSFDITDYIKNGDNNLTVEIANTWSNRIVGDALAAEKYTKTNITNTFIPGIDKVYVPWEKVPLISSGLLGPVTIQTMDLIK
jgi:hypothetical protein